MPAVIRLETTDGETYEIEQPYFEGHPETPMSWKQLTKKFALLAEGVYDDDQQARIVEIVRNMEDHDASDLVETLVVE
jgi:2-methylcitrate dehydratase PrpD